MDCLRVWGLVGRRDYLPTMLYGLGMTSFWKRAFSSCFFLMALVTFEVAEDMEEELEATDTCCWSSSPCCSFSPVCWISYTVVGEGEGGGNWVRGHQSCELTLWTSPLLRSPLMASTATMWLTLMSGCLLPSAWTNKQI